MVARSGQQVRRLLLRRRWLPKKPCDRVGVCGFGDLGELESVLGGTGGVDVRGSSCRMAVEYLDLGSISNHHLLPGEF